MRPRRHSDLNRFGSAGGSRDGGLLGFLCNPVSSVDIEMELIDVIHGSVVEEEALKTFSRVLVCVTCVFTLHPSSQQVRLPHADVVEPSAQTLDRQRLEPVLRLQFCQRDGEGDSSN